MSNAGFYQGENAGTAVGCDTSIDQSFDRTNLLRRATEQSLLSIHYPAVVRVVRVASEDVPEHIASVKMAPSFAMRSMLGVR